MQPPVSPQFFLHFFYDHDLGAELQDSEHVRNASVTRLPREATEEADLRGLLELMLNESQRENRWLAVSLEHPVLVKYLNARLKLVELGVLERLNASSGVCLTFTPSARRRLCGLEEVRLSATHAA